ncbi:MAG TPA: hypothetical protein V6C95_20435 [Coleofasciculaceae cyanobacterium]
MVSPLFQQYISASLEADDSVQPIHQTQEYLNLAYVQNRDDAPYILTDEPFPQPEYLHRTLAQEEQFDYIFFDEDCLMKGGVVLTKQTNTYSNFSLSTFSLAPATSPEGVFERTAFGEAVINFNVYFSEGDQVDSLQGTFILMHGLSQHERGRWIACVSSTDCDVAIVQGLWFRRKV